MSTFRREQFVEQFQSAIRSARSVESTAALARIASFARRSVAVDAAGFSLAQRTAGSAPSARRVC